MFGVSSMTGQLRKVALLKPSEALIKADPKKWHYGSIFDPKKINDIHESFTNLLIDNGCLLYTSPSPRDKRQSRMPSSA